MITRTDNDGGVVYRLNDMPHRLNGPAFEWLDGTWSWALYGKVHRYYGPAASNLLLDQYHGGNSKYWVLHGEAVR